LWHKPQQAVANIALLLGSVVLVLLVCEFVAFRFIFLPSDVPRNVFRDGLIRYASEQSGVWRVKDEIRAPYAINREGWNSSHREYRPERTPGLSRIVIIGDSYVEAFQVPVTASLAEQLEHSLPSTEVYRVAISGAPLSQYLLMLEREGVRYAPDLVVIVLIQNDFDESFRFMPGRYTSSFLKLRLEEGRIMEEVQPSLYHPGPWEWLRFTATARYLCYRRQIAMVMPRFQWNAPKAGSNFQANIDTSAVLERTTDVALATDYLFRRLAAVAIAHNFALLLVMDGDRYAIYSGMDSAALYRNGALAINALAGRAAESHGIAFIDLHARFERDWLKNHRRFDFESDNHWNQYGHAIAAAAIEDFVRHRH
jgi:hypothetical protein